MVPSNPPISDHDLWTWKTNLYIQVATTAWLLYDYFLTLSKEKRCIWESRWSAVKVVFLIGRYVALLNQALLASQFAPWFRLSVGGSTACNLVSRLGSVLDAILYLNLAVFSAVRVYAVCQRNLWRALIVFSLIFIEVACDAYTNNAGLFKSLPSPFSGCGQYLTSNETVMVVLGKHQPQPTAYRVTAYFGTTCIILGELIAQIYTWENTFRIRRALLRDQVRHSLATLLLRDGTLLFLILAAWSITTRIVTFIDLASTALPATSMLICRFILRLRQVQLLDPVTGTSSTTSRFVGNMGAPLDLADLDSDDEELDDDDTLPTYFSDNPLIIGLQIDSDHYISFGASRCSFSTTKSV